MYSKLLFHVYRPRILKTFEAVAFAPKPRNEILSLELRCHD